MMDKLSRLAGWILINVPAKYIHPVRWWNKWLWRIGADEARIQMREHWAQQDLEKRQKAFFGENQK